MLQPSLALLFVKTFALLGIFGITGWALVPQNFFKESRTANWITWQVLGLATFLLLGFNLTNFDIPAKYCALALPAALLFRWVRSRAKRVAFVSLPKCGRELGLYALLSLLFASFYLAPFVVRNSSGLYAYGGGDQSSYFRFSDIVTDRSLASYIHEWEAKEGPIEQREPSTLYPPNPNWSILQMVYYIKGMRTMLTFANQTVAVPFFSLLPGSRVESYSAGVAAFFVLLAWAGALFVNAWGPISRRRLAWSAFAVAVGSPVYSLVWKHTIPSVSAWTMALIILAVLARQVLVERRAISSPFFFGVLLSAGSLMYLPALAVTGLAWLYVIYHLGRHSGWRRTLYVAISVIALVLLFMNREIDRPFRLLLMNSTGALLDYHVRSWMLYPTLSGLADFETLLSVPRFFQPFHYAGVVAVLVGWICAFVFAPRAQRIFWAVFLLPFALGIKWYLFRVGHYHVIRMAEFVGVVMLALLAFGLTGLWQRASTASLGRARSMRALAIVIAVLFGVGSAIYRTQVFATVLSPALNPRVAYSDADALNLGARIEDISANHLSVTQGPIFYWMRWGAVEFANHEILFRHVPYAEAFEYDYVYVQLNLLSQSNADHAVLVGPRREIPDILSVSPEFLPDTSADLANGTGPYRLLPTQSVRGAALVGTGWMAPNLERKEWVRYIRPSNEAGLFAWTDKPGWYELEVQSTQLTKPAVMLSVHYGDDPPLKVPSTYEGLRRASETAKGYFDRLRTGFNPTLVAGLESDMQSFASLPLDAYNFKLAQSPSFAAMHRYRYDEGNVDEWVERASRGRELRYRLDLKSNFRVAVYLRPGVNVLRFIVRNERGGRGGADLRSRTRYHDDGKLEYATIKSVKLSPLAGPAPLSAGPLVDLPDRP